MWQPDIKSETASYPPGGVAPSSYALLLHTYLEKLKARLRRRWRASPTGTKRATGRRAPPDKNRRERSRLFL